MHTFLRLGSAGEASLPRDQPREGIFDSRDPAIGWCAITHDWASTMRQHGALAQPWRILSHKSKASLANNTNPAKNLSASSSLRADHSRLAPC